MLASRHYLQYVHVVNAQIVHSILVQRHYSEQCLACYRVTGIVHLGAENEVVRAGNEAHVHAVIRREELHRTGNTSSRLSQN